MPMHSTPSRSSTTQTYLDEPGPPAYKGAARFVGSSSGASSSNVSGRERGERDRDDDSNASGPLLTLTWESKYYEYYMVSQEAGTSDKDLLKALIYYFEENSQLENFLMWSITREVAAVSASGTPFREDNISTAVLVQYGMTDKACLKYLRHMIKPLLKRLAGKPAKKDASSGMITISFLTGGGGTVSSNTLPLTRSNGSDSFEKIDMDSEDSDSGTMSSSAEDNSHPIPDVLMSPRMVPDLPQVVVDGVADLVDRLVASIQMVPPLFRAVYRHVYKTVGQRFPHMELAAVGGLFFLRYLCHAITFPETYGLVKKVKSTDRRTLVQVSKMLQSMANGDPMGPRDSSTSIALIGCQQRVQDFLREISLPSPDADGHDGDKGKRVGSSAPPNSGNLSGSKAKDAVKLIKGRLEKYASSLQSKMMGSPPTTTIPGSTSSSSLPNLTTLSGFPPKRISDSETGSPSLPSILVRPPNLISIDDSLTPLTPPEKRTPLEIPSNTPPRPGPLIRHGDRSSPHRNPPLSYQWEEDAPSNSSPRPAAPIAAFSLDGGSPVHTASTNASTVAPSPSPTPTLHEVLRHQQLTHLFLAFCANEFSSGPVTLLLEIQHFQAHPSRDLAHHIFQRFLVDGAEEEIDLPVEAKTQVRAKLAREEIDQTLFNRVYKLVFGMVSLDSYARFTIYDKNRKRSKSFL